MISTVINVLIARAIHAQNKQGQTGLRIALLNSAAESAAIIVQV